MPFRFRRSRADLAAGRLALLTAVLCAGTVSLAAPGAAEVARPKKLVEAYPFPLDFNHFYSYEDVVGTLQRVAERFPGLTELVSIGTSRGGRDLWMMRVTDESIGDPSRKPALYVDGNIHGNEIQATEVCLYVLHTLVNRFDRDEYVRTLLETRTFYIVPTANPDSRVAFFAEANSPHAPRGNVRPVDEDLDGREDEDGPEDINGDGVITSMRKRDPFGEFKTGGDPRVLEPRELDEKGEWTFHWSEGIDNDGDGLVNEDGVGGVDMNRNFPADWQPEYVQEGAGPYPTSEPEIRAIVEFVLAHRNIAAVQSFHNSGNLILYPFGSRAFVDMPPRDQAVYGAIHRRGKEILPHYKPGSILDDLYRVYGSTVDFGYIQWGAIAFTNELWDWVLDYDGDGEVSREERLRWSDERLHGEAFVEWTPFQHPELGEVEIGGWTQFHSRIPPVEFLEEMCRLNADFVLFHAEAMPHLEITRTEVASLSEGLVAFDLFVANTGVMDTYPELAQRLGVARPVVATLETSPGVRIVDGGPRPRERALRTITYGPADRRLPRPERIEIGQIQGGQEVAVRWLLAVEPGGERWVRGALRSDKAGDATSSRVVLEPESR
jgi:hypothetical protein